MVLAVIMMITLVPLGVFAQDPAQGNTPTDALSSATYYTKPNWEARIKDKSRWKVEDTQTLVRVTTSDPVRMNDIDYDGMYINANGRYVIRLIYKERTQSPSAVWHKALINFGDLDQYIDFSNSYVFGRDGKTRYTFDPVKGIKGRGFDVRNAAGDRTNGRKNLPINLVLKDGVKLETLGKKNYIIQMRLCDDDYKRVYAYAPGKSSMDYSTYTKTTSVSLEDNLNNLFIKGGYQEDSNNATSQEFFMSEFIANPEKYKDEKNLGIIRTQYMGQTSTIVREEVGGEPIAFTQVFDANLLNYLVNDNGDDTIVGYVNVLTVAREVSPYSQNVPIKRKDINTTKVDDNSPELAYVVIGTQDFASKNPKVKVVEIPKNDQHTILSSNYITAIDYVVDKKKFEDTFSSGHTRKLDYSTMSGWTNPNKDGWLVYEKAFDNDYVVQEGDSFMVDAGAAAKGKQIMIQVGGEQAILRRPQGYYNGYATSKSALDAFEEIADGVFQFTIGEGTTVKSGKSLKIYMPYTDKFEGDEKINFLQIHNGTKLNEGAANLTLLKTRLINMHLYKQGKKGHFVLRYTLKNGAESSLKFEPKLTWKYEDKDGVMTGAANGATLPSGGNFYINTAVLKEGTDIIVDSYDGNGNKIDSETSWFKYIPLEKSKETVKLITWTDHSDKRSVLSINKSLYTPYQVLFTNDYADGTDDFYKDPRVLPADNAKFNTETTKIVGYTKYDSGKVRTLYEGPQKLFSKVEAAGNEYDNDGNLKGTDVRKEIKIAKKDIFDAQFKEDSKTYKAYEYTFDLEKMLPYHSDDKTETKLTLLKDMKFVSTASDGSSLPSDLIETRVRARVLFDATDGAWTEDNKEVKKAVKIVPDNDKFYGEKGYAANGFEGANADTNTGDKFPEAPKLEGKNFLGWVTKEGKDTLGKTIVSASDFNNLPKEQVFTNTTPVEKHLVVYAIYSEDTVVTFDANGGIFEGDKDELAVKAEGSNVTKPTDPKRDGYTFKGWADSKTATTADENILTNVNASKTVYAVWEQKADKKLTLTDPEPVPVSDKKDLTAKEKDAIKDAVIKANPTLTKDDITVGSDGKVTVTKGDKTGEIPADKTVKQKEVINKINPPKKPVEVANPDSLTDGEKGKVKDAIIAANPDLNLKPEEVTVDEKGNVTIEQGGKTGEVPADKTVVKADNVLKLDAPDKVEVKDPNNLTQEEKDAVAAAVKEKNKDKLSNDAVVTVDANGNVTVTDGDKTGKLEGKDTVKKFDRTGKTLNDPKELTEVSDLNKLTENEKDEVREAVKAANPDLHFKDEEIQVDDNGKVTVPMGTDESGKTIYKEIAPEKTVKKDDTTKTISLKAPKLTPVADPTSLTTEEKGKVEEAVKEANQDLPADAKITVADDGSVTVTQGDKSGMLAQADTVVKKLDPPEVATDEGGNIKVRPTDDRTSETEVTYKDPQGNDQKVIAKKDPTTGEWKIDPSVEGVKVDKDTGVISIPGDKIQNGSDVNAVAKDGENTSDGKTATSKDNKAPANPDVKLNDDNSVTVTPPTDKDTKSVKVTITDPDGTKKEFVVEKEGDSWKLPADAPEGTTIVDGKITIPADKIKPGAKVSASATDGNNNTSSEVGVTTKSQTDDVDPILPKKTPVANPNSLTETEQKAVKKAIEKANEGKFPTGTTVEVGTDGKATITYPDGSKDTIEGSRLVEKVDKTELQKEVDKNKNDAIKNSDKYKNADQTKKDAYDSALDKANKVLEDPHATQKDVDDALKALKEAETALGGNASDELNDPAKVAVKDPTNLTKEEKQAIKDAVKKANPGLTDEQIAVDKEGNVTVTKDGEQPKTLGKDKTVSTDVKAPAITEVANKSQLTKDEKNAVKEAVKKANTGLTDDQIEVKDDGTVVVTKDGKETTIPASDVVKDDTTPGAELNDPAKVAVKDPTNLTKEEKQAIKDAVKKANPGLTDEQIAVDKEGNVTVTKDGEQPKTLGKDKTVSTDVKAPAITEVANKSQLTKDEKNAVKEAVKKANTGLTDDQIEVKDDGTVVVTKDGKETTIPASDVVKDDTTPGAELKAPKTPVKVKDPSKLTDDEKEAVKKAVKDANPKLPADATIDVADDGTVTVTDKDGKEIGKLKPEQTVKGVVNAPEKPVEVKDPSNLTPEEKKAVEDAVKKANPDLPEGAKVTVGDDGSVTVTDKDGNEIGKLPAAKTVDKRVPRPLPELYYPDTTVGVGDERTIYPIGTPGYVSEALEGIDAPRGVYVRVNPDGSISVEVSPRYSGPSIFTIRGYVYVDGILTPISINVRVEGGSRRRHNRRDDVEDEDINEDTREVYTHKAYIFGYPDGTVRPNGNVTRAEAAAMLARLLEDENTASALKPAFTDTPSHWYNRAINAALSRGVMKGYPDGTFKPNAPITRAEFTQMISQIDAKPYGVAPFADVKDHWAKLAIGKEYAAGRISGYPDGTFRPNAPITRAEAAHILNKIFDRNYDSVSAIQSEDRMNINVFGDLFTSFWGYNDMVEATNTHTFRRRSKNSVSEDWSEINRISR